MFLRRAVQTIRPPSLRLLSTQTGQQDDVIRDLFYAFAHPGNDTSEPYLSTSDLGDLLRAIGERPSQKRLDKLLTKYDEDNSGTIELSEFLNGKKAVLKHEDSELEVEGISDIDLDHVVSAFGTLDKNGDGFVCVDDLTGLLSTVGGNMSREDAEEIIKIGDTDLDNKLNIMEFLGRFNLFL